MVPQLSKLLDTSLTGLDSHGQAGSVHAERADAGEDVDAPICSGWALADAGDTLGAEYLGYEVRQSVPYEPLGHHLTESQRLGPPRREPAVHPGSTNDRRSGRSALNP